MKKRNLIICIIAMVAIICVACANKAVDYTVESEEIVLPEDSELPTPSETVEKIINEEDVIDIPVVEVEEPVYEEVEPITITVYYVFGQFDEFQIQEEEIKELLPDMILTRLSMHNIVPVDSVVESFEECEDEDGKKGLTLVISSSFDAYIDTMSVEAQNAIYASVANTFLSAYDADYITIGDIYSEWCDVPLQLLELNEDDKTAAE